MQNGNKLKVNSASTLPQFDNVVEQFLQPMSVGVIEKQMIDGYLTEIILKKKIMAVRTPLTTKDLIIKPEGQRGWSWERLVTTSDVIFNLDDRIYFDQTKYRVMARAAYKEYGFLEYHITQDFDKVGS